MMREQTRIRIHNNPAAGRWDLMIVARNYATGEVSVAEPIVMNRADPGALIPITAVFDDEAIQGLMEDLWAAGIRPKCDRVDAAGLVEAQKAHIADLRSIIDRTMNRGDT